MVEWDPTRVIEWQKKAVWEEQMRTKYNTELERNRLTQQIKADEDTNATPWLGFPKFQHWYYFSSQSIWRSQRARHKMPYSARQVYRAYQLWTKIATYYKWRYDNTQDIKYLREYNDMVREQFKDSFETYINDMQKSVRLTLNLADPDDKEASDILLKTLEAPNKYTDRKWPGFPLKDYYLKRKQKAEEEAAKPPDPPPPPPQIIEEVKKAIQKEEDERTRAEEGEGRDAGGGLTVPGTSYVGPGNPVPAGPPSGPVDQAALEHDQRYSWLLSLGDWPYLLANEADKIMSDDLEEKAHTMTSSEKVLANLVRSVWHIKETLSDMFPDLAKTLLHGTKTGTETKKRPYIEPETDAPAFKLPKREDESVSYDGEGSTVVVTGQTEGGMSSSTETAAGDSSVNGGGGGATPQCGGTFWGGSSFNDGFIITRQTRRVVTDGSLDTYKPHRSMTATPEVIVATPWHFLDINKLSCHFSPANFQEMLETGDGLRPVQMRIKIHELIFKDITTSKEGTTTVQDSSSGILLITEDKNYDFPYPMGGGQFTTPGHLPGELYAPPMYSYRTHGYMKPQTVNNYAYPYGPGPNTELFLLENQDLQLIHSGQCFEQIYNFPESLPFQPLTQYPWDARRDDNPTSEQRLVVMQKEKDEDSARQGLNLQLGPQGKTDFVYFSNRLPAAWLANPRFADGDLLHFDHTEWKGADFTKKSEKKARPDQEPARITVRDTTPYGNYEKHQTFQPGPATVDNAVRRPEGDTLITSNALATIDEEEVPFGIPKHRNLNGRLFILEQIGHGAPTDPLHIRDTKFDDIKLPNPGQEIAAGLFPGSLLEGQSPGLESQIWVRTPNTQGGAMLPEFNPLAMWAMKNPPPTIFLRMLKPLGPPMIQDGKIIPSETTVKQYCQFLLSYEIKWEIIPRRRGTKRWNPAPPIQPPAGRDPSQPVYNLNFDDSGNVRYNKPDTVWMLRQRPRFNR
ncbi:VP1 [Sesavirus CSL10538]|uniref:VP1 n=1 Tax=Sesavirus CSL10538 TaxID=1519097 RepID=A0A0B4N000_9VIRU|nr:VP1 [Sesavirus CSL10538]AIE58041.1 VP1 [Sesavirus CSL10538]